MDMIVQFGDTRTAHTNRRSYQQGSCWLIPAAVLTPSDPRLPDWLQD